MRLKNSRSLLVLAVLILFGIFLVGVVSGADINWALPSNGATSDHSQINDNNWNNYYSGGSGTVTLDGSVTISSITYKVQAYAHAESSSGESKAWANRDLEIRQNSVWTNIDTCSKSSSSTSATADCSGTFPIPGPWNNVERVRVIVSTNTQCGVVCGGTSEIRRIYEIEAMGPEPCTSNDSYSCYDNDVYWYDGCGVREEKKEECNHGITYGAWGEGYCYNNTAKVQNRTRTEKGCSGDSCYDNNYLEENITSCLAGGICLGGDCVLIEKAYWADMADPLTEIFQADLNDRVKLMVAGEWMHDKQINYTIYECEAVCQFTEGAIRWFDREVAQAFATGFTTWAAEEGEYYFEAEIIETGDKQISGQLDVLNTEDNSPPSVKINSPEDRQIYFLNEVLNFSADISDEDDDFGYLWDLGDGEIRAGNSITLESYNFSYDFKTTEQKEIILTVTDDRGESSKDKSSILIVNSTYVMAYIDEPKWGEDIRGFNVSFNATGSYAVNSTIVGNCRNITCLAGNCPGEAKGIPPNYSGSCSLPIIVEKAPAPFDDLSFSWAFDDGTSYNAKGINGALFKKTFSYPGEHWAKLSASINPEGSTETNFSTSLTGICQIDLEGNIFGKMTWVWWDEYGEPHDTVDPVELGICLHNDQTANPPHCCPPGYACNETDPGDPQSAKCQPSTDDYCANIVFCEDYLTENECLNDTCGRGALQPGSTCGGIIEVDAICGAEYFTSRADMCNCVWNSTTGACFHKADLWSTIYTDLPFIHSCTTLTQHGSCIDGLMSVNVEGTVILSWNEIYLQGLLDDPPNITEYPSFPAGGDTDDVEDYLNDLCNFDALCRDYAGSVLCGGPLIKLIFFTLGNLIITIIIIVLAYAIWLSRKKEAARKKTRKEIKEKRKEKVSKKKIRKN